MELEVERWNDLSNARQCRMNCVVCWMRMEGVACACTSIANFGLGDVGIAVCLHAGLRSCLCIEGRWYLWQCGNDVCKC